MSRYLRKPCQEVTEISGRGDAAQKYFHSYDCRFCWVFHRLDWRQNWCGSSHRTWRVISASYSAASGGSSLI